MNEAKLAEYLRVGKKLFDGEITFKVKKKGKTICETLDDREGYKLKLIEALARARAAVLDGDDGWGQLVKDGLAMKGIKKAGNPSDWRNHPAINDWIQDRPDDALRALQEIWADEDTPSAERIRGRIRAFVAEVPPHDKWGGVGAAMTRLPLVAHLLLGLGPEYPPFRITQFEKVWDYLEYPRPSKKEEGEVYKHTLDFLDKIKDQSHALGYERPKDRLDAQSLVWTMHGFVEKAMKNGNSISENVPELPDPLTKLGKDLLLKPESFLSKTVWPLLEDKKQLIFQGPPGTGKTFVARELAKFLAGSEDRVRVVQFHPSYAYEDFVQGFRPTLRDGKAGFELRDGPLLQMADQAWSRLNERHFLIIDEINRGNLSKILGELYYLLEYRADDDEADDDEFGMQLQYSDEPFAMPPNLYIIGTMNTADRSIALVDAALRRRFYFVPFHPDKEPIKDLLREWLKGNARDLDDDVVGLVSLANGKLSNKEAAIGPSYFMKKGGLDQTKLERAWKYNVLPYIEEQLYGSNLSLAEFELPNLRKELAQGNDTAGAQGEATTGGDDTG